jgi:hypothetical protein
MTAIEGRAPAADREIRLRGRREQGGVSCAKIVASVVARRRSARGRSGDPDSRAAGCDSRVAAGRWRRPARVPAASREARRRAHRPGHGAERTADADPRGSPPFAGRWSGMQVAAEDNLFRDLADSDPTRLSECPPGVPRGDGRAPGRARRGHPVTGLPPREPRGPRRCPGSQRGVLPSSRPLARSRGMRFPRVALRRRKRCIGAQGAHSSLEVRKENK